MHLNILDLKSLSKVKYTDDNRFQLQSYMTELSVPIAHMRFKIATEVVPTVQKNFQSDPTLSANI